MLKEGTQLIISGVVIFLLSFLILVIWPPFGFLLDSWKNIWVLGFFIIGLSSGMILCLRGYFHIKRPDDLFSDSLPVSGFWGFLFWRIIGIWLLMVGMEICLFFAFWMYSFYIEGTVPLILVFTPIIAKSDCKIK